MGSPQKIYYEVYLRILKKWKFTQKMRTGQALRYWADEVGSRARNNGKMSSLGIKGFKNPALAPLFITMTGGMIFVAAYCIRSLTGNMMSPREKELKPLKINGRDNN